MTRVIHTGDTHLGYQQYHAPERREDFLDAFRQVIDDAVGDDVDAVVHAGDLFHDRRPTLTDVLGTLDVLRTLDDAGIPFLAIVGNHEAKRDAQWLDLFESLGLATRLGDDPEVVGDTAFYGLDFVPRSKRDDLAYDFEPHDAAHAALVTHGLFQPFDHGDWDAREIIEGASVDFDALLLGDDHQADTAQVEETWLTYCGSTERTAADEREERGYNIVTFDDAVQISRRGLDTREFVRCEVELAGDEGVERVRQRVGEHDMEDAVVIVRISGEGDPVTPASVEEFALDRGALVARVSDERELADDRSVDVSFADPDDAVRERVRDMGLSEAAIGIDETVRASKVADSNVADEVESQVRELVESRDVDAFEAAPDDGATGSSDSGGEGSGEDREVDPAVDGRERDADRAGTVADAADGTQPDDGTRTADDAGPDDGTAADGEDGAGDGTEDEQTRDEGASAAADGAGGDGQSSMEEFL